MKYKMMIVASLLVPVACHGSDMQPTEMRIKELEDARFKEEEIAHLSRKIHEELHPYFEYKAAALGYWNPADDQDKEASFEKFVKELVEKVDAGEDITSIIEEEPNIEKDVGENRGIVFFILRFVLQERFLLRMMTNYKQLVSEFLVVNKELKRLR